MRRVPRHLEILVAASARHQGWLCTGGEAVTDLPPVSVLENILQAALEERDMVGVGHVLKLIAVQDPHRAATLMDTLNVGIAISKERHSSNPQEDG